MLAAMRWILFLLVVALLSPPPAAALDFGRLRMLNAAESKP